MTDRTWQGAGIPRQRLLHAAYAAALYRVWWRGHWLELRAAARNAALEHALRQAKVRQWAWITAANPASRLLAARRNALRNLALRDALRRRGWRALPAQSEGDGWPVEHGYWIPGMPAREARILGCRHGQAAVLWSRLGDVPHVLWCGRSAGR